MKIDVIKSEHSARKISPLGSEVILPSIITQAGERTANRFIEFFLVEIRNRNTRQSYARALKQFLDWCDQRGVRFFEISSVVIAAYIEQHQAKAPTVNQHLSAIKTFYAFLVKGGILQVSPAAEVKGPKHKVKKGKTPVLNDDEMRELLSSIDCSHVVGLRDRALIATMFFSFARVSAVLSMSVGDYYPVGKRYWLRFREKGGKEHEVPAHHTVEEALDLYIEAGDLEDPKDGPLFRTTVGRSRKLTTTGLQRREALAMVKRRALAAGVSTAACNHTFRASGITNFLRNGGSRDNAQRIACHEDVRTTALYDRRDDVVSLDEIERIRL